jgi:hypothetical protein
MCSFWHISFVLVLFFFVLSSITDRFCFVFFFNFPGIFRPPYNNSDEYLNYAMANRNEWAKRGHEIVDEMAARFNEHAYLSAE